MRRVNSFFYLMLAAACGGAAIGACSAGQGGSSFGEGTGGSNTATDTQGGNTNVGGNTNNGGSGVFIDASNPEGGDLTDGEVCNAEEAQAELIALDM